MSIPDLERPTETNITKSILRYLKTLDKCFAWKVHGGMYGTAGIPDIIACYHGRFFAFEIKRPGCRPSDIQEVAMRKIKKAGGEAFIVNSKKQVMQVLGDARETRKK